VVPGEDAARKNERDIAITRELEETGFENTLNASACDIVDEKKTDRGLAICGFSLGGDRELAHGAVLDRIEKSNEVGCADEYLVVARVRAYQGDWFRALVSEH
jgi:hypothetical protein